MSARATVWFAVVAIAGAFIAWWMVESASTPIRPEFLHDSPRANLAPAPGSDATQRIPTPPFPTRIEPDAMSPKDSLSAVARRYRDAKDKRKFFDEALRLGGSANAHFAWEAIADCSFVFRTGVVGAEQRLAGSMDPNDREYQARLEAHQKRYAGCTGFEGFQATTRDLAAVYERQGVGDDALANFYRALKTGRTHMERQEVLLPAARRLIETGDPYAVFEVGARIARLSVDVEKCGGRMDGCEESRRANMESNAWVLAACDLGMECGMNSTAVLDNCIGGGGCERTDVESVMLGSSELDDSAREAIQTRRREIGRAIAHRDWARLGL